MALHGGAPWAADQPGREVQTSHFPDDENGRCRPQKETAVLPCKAVPHAECSAGCCRHVGPIDSAESGRHHVVLWVDSFTDAMGPDIALDALKVLRAAGCSVELSGPGVCCGLTLITTGQLKEAKGKLTKSLDILHPQVAAGKTIVGLEPSCTAVMRSDLLELLPDDPRAISVSRATKTVSEFLRSINWAPPLAAEKLLVQPHCHQYSVMGYSDDLKILESMGCDVEVSSGCCGLAGNFGMEKGHYEISAKIAEEGILRKAADNPERAVMADGFSCRTQVADLADIDSRHLVQVIAEALDNNKPRLLNMSSSQSHTCACGS